MIRIGISIKAWSAAHGDACVKFDVFREGRARCIAEGALAKVVREHLQAMVDTMQQGVVASGAAVQFSDGTLVGMQAEPGKELT